MKTMDLFQPEHKQALVDVHNMCCFNKKDSDSFWKKVFEAGEIENGELVSQDSFEMAMMKAKEILLQEGMRIFTRKRPTFNPLLSRYKNQ